MSDERKRDEEAAEKWCLSPDPESYEQGWERPTRLEIFEEQQNCAQHMIGWRGNLKCWFKKAFLDGLAHCRETEVNKLVEYRSQAADRYQELMTENLKLREQLRVAVEALEGLTNAALAGLKPLQSQIDAGFYALKKLEASREGR